MKFSTLAILALLILPMHSIVGQDDVFTLKDYKYPDLRRDVLNTYFDFNNDFGVKKEKVEDVETEKENNVFVGLDARLDYSQYRQNRNWQRTFSAIMDNNIDQRRTKDQDDTVEKELENKTYFSLATDNRRYFKNNIFVEGYGQLILDYTHNKASFTSSTSPTTSESIGKLTNRYARLNIGVGKGRLEYVGDAHIAMYILKDIKKYDLLAQSLAPEDYKALADVIARVGNERFFDGRHKRIFQLEQIDSVLQARGILAEGDVKAFTLINDNLFFGNVPTRFSGGRFSVGLQGGHFLSKSKLENDNNTTEATTTSFDRGAYVAYNFEIPASLLIQHSFRIKAGYLFDTNEFEEDVLNFTNADINASLGYELGFFPNTRTRFSVYGRVDGNVRNQVRDETLTEVETTVSNVWARIGTEMYYYVSPQFRLSGSYRLSYRSNEARVDKVSNPFYDTGTTLNTDTGSGFHIGLDYFIF